MALLTPPCRSHPQSKQPCNLKSLHATATTCMHQGQSPAQCASSMYLAAHCRGGRSHRDRAERVAKVRAAFPLPARAAAPGAMHDPAGLDSLAGWDILERDEDPDGNGLAGPPTPSPAPGQGFAGGWTLVWVCIR